MLRVAFVEYNLGYRGTQGSVWAYALYNEELLGNKSYILTRTHPNIRNEDIDDQSIKYFVDHFEVYHTSDESLDKILSDLAIDVAFVVLGGKLHDVKLPSNIPTITHCIFGTENKEGTLQTAISEYVAQGTCDVLPNIVMVHDTYEDLREELKIPEDAMVFGRYGGYTTFDIEYVQDTVINFAQKHSDTYFLFMHTKPFGPSLPNIIFMPGTRDLEYKTKFINTCDAMLHARSQGETFGMSVGEFVMKGKPILTSEQGDTAHIEFLMGQVQIYHDPESLWKLLATFDRSGISPDATRYPEFVPEKVMPIFSRLLSKCMHANEDVSK
jgi:hypothetical protein